MAYTPYFENEDICSDENLMKSLYYEDNEQDIDKKFPIQENGDWILIHGEFIFPRKNSKGILNEMIVSKFQRNFYPAMKKTDSEQIDSNFLPDGFGTEQDRKRKIFYPKIRLLYDDLGLIIKEKTIETSYILKDGEFVKSDIPTGEYSSLRIGIPTLVPSPVDDKPGNGSVEYDGVMKLFKLHTDSNGIYRMPDEKEIIRLQKKSVNGDMSDILELWYGNLGHTAKLYIASLTNQLLINSRITYKNQTLGFTEDEIIILDNFIKDYRQNPSKYDVEKFEK